MLTQKQKQLVKRMDALQKVMLDLNKKFKKIQKDARSLVRAQHESQDQKKIAQLKKRLSR